MCLQIYFGVINYSLVFCLGSTELQVETLVKYFPGLRNISNVQGSCIQAITRGEFFPIHIPTVKIMNPCWKKIARHLSYDAIILIRVRKILDIFKVLCDFILISSNNLSNLSNLVPSRRERQFLLSLSLRHS